MLRINKSICLSERWQVFDARSVTLPPDDQELWLKAAAKCSTVSSRREAMAFTKADMVELPPEEGNYYWVFNKGLLRFRAAVGVPTFDRLLGDWPWDKANFLYDADAVSDFKDRLAYGGIGFFIWSY